MKSINVIPYLSTNDYDEICIMFVRRPKDAITVSKNKILYYIIEMDEEYDITEFVLDFTEEEYFMNTISWEHDIPYYAVIEIVKLGIDWLKQYKKTKNYIATNPTITIEY